MSARRIAFFGRKGVGVSTVAANLCAALAEAGQQPAVVCCRGDGAVGRLLGERPVLPLRHGLYTREHRWRDYAGHGFHGSLVLETGGVDAAELDTALALAEDVLATATGHIDCILYDLADADLAALLTLHRQSPLDGVVAVAGGDPLALQSINELFRELRALADSGHPCGEVFLVGNQVSEPYAETLLDDFARQTQLAAFAHLPRSLVVIRSTFFGATVIDAAPRTHQARLYRRLAKIVGQSGGSTAQMPVPMDEEVFRDWLLEWGERLFAYDDELLTGGAAI